MITPAMQVHQPKNLWDNIKVGAKRASLAGQKAKIQADILMLDQKIKGCKQEFGVELYEFLVKCVENEPEFLLDNSALDKIQGLFLKTYKDNKAVAQKMVLQDEKLAQCAEKRAQVNSRHGGRLSFEVPADSVGERIINAPKNARIAGTETKLKANKALMEREIKANKQKFGVDVYQLLVDLEVFQKWMPSDRDVQLLYSQVRREIAQLELIKEEKFDEAEHLGK
jgi:hypothetical protein